MESIVTNLDLFVVLKDHFGSFSCSDKLFDYLKDRLDVNTSEQKHAALLKFCQRFCSNIREKWEKANRTLAPFIKRNGDWLETPISWPKEIILSDVEVAELEDTISENTENVPPTTPTTPQPSTSSISPRKPFEELCSRQKRRRVNFITKSLSPEEISSANKRIQSGGNTEINKIMDHLLNHPEDIQKVQNCLQKVESSRYSLEKALALSVFLNLSKWQYINLRESACEQGTDIYPSYYKLKQAKLTCYPAKDQITITEDGAAVKLQALLDITVSRLLEAIDFDLSTNAEIELITKWGFDGASSQSNYKQRASFDDSSVFMASLVPLRLMRNGEVEWENDRHSSKYSCRPIMFQFIKETRETVMAFKDSLQNEIDSLQQTKVQNVTVQHKLLMTMIDGKISSYLSETSSSVCDICRVKPSEMNNLDAIDAKQRNYDMYEYGLSSLHAWIRCMECMLHIGYRLDFKKWTAKDDNKEKMAQKKKQIQQAFKDQCGLLVDVVKQGAGTTNDGNTARRFFGDSKTSALITGVNEDLIERFHVILQVIASGERVDTSKFSFFCRETASLYIELYPWYYMPASVHKLLIHGADIIEHFNLLPIGTLSEEASEARNKDFRMYRESHSRKFSRTATNEDILHNLLLSSDPKLTAQIPRLPKKRRMALSPKAVELLIPLRIENNEIDFIDINTLKDSSSDSE